MVRGCGVLAGQLAIGELPATAIRAAASEAELFVPVAAALEIGSSPIAAFRLAAARSGCEALHQLADGWQVCIRTGMPLGETVQAVVANVERELERETTREAELASARTTGRMLAALPLVGFLMGYAVDADPLEFITGSGFGQWCLLGACCLAGAGLIWTEKLAAPSRAPKPNARLGLLAARLALRSDLWDVWGLLGLSGASMPPGLRSATFESPSDQAAERVAFAPALELLAAVVSTGAPLRSATATVGQVVAGPLGRRLRELQALTDIGLSDAEAWRTLREHPLWGEVARQIAHGADSGAGLGVILRRAAVRHRNRVSADLLVQARQVGVKSALPLMTCYLPAFLLVGVLPIIGSLASGFLR
jgi:Flp pilus assembly protein TadB